MMYPASAQARVLRAARVASWMVDGGGGKPEAGLRVGIESGHPLAGQYLLDGNWPSSVYT
eukprot:scaffold30257_cov160-Skeletonema_menzelii.AAC.2